MVKSKKLILFLFLIAGVNIQADGRQFTKDDFLKAAKKCGWSVDSRLVPSQFSIDDIKLIVSNQARLYISDRAGDRILLHLSGLNQESCVTEIMVRKQVDQETEAFVRGNLESASKSKFDIGGKLAGLEFLAIIKAARARSKGQNEQFELLTKEVEYWRCLRKKDTVLTEEDLSPFGCGDHGIYRDLSEFTKALALDIMQEDRAKKN